MTGPVYVFLANFAIFEPYIYPLHLLQGNVRKVAPDIIVGPYPDYGLLASLHARGVKVIVSLLDPRLIYETSLIHKEKQLSKTLGMKDYDFPMNSRQSPRSALNSRAMARVRAFIAAHPHTKIYIHCYLGKHRVGDVVTMLRHHGEVSREMVRRDGVRAGQSRQGDAAAGSGWIDLDAPDTRQSFHESGAEQHRRREVAAMARRV